MRQRSRNDILCRDVYPKDMQRYVGIEVEGLYPRGGCRDTFAKLAADWLYKSILRKGARLKWDRSIDEDKGIGFELTLLIPERRLAQHLTGLSKFLNHFSVEVNDSCGLHIHLDVRGRDRLNSLLNLWAAQQVLFSLVPEGRRGNTFCVYAENLHHTLNNHHSAVNITKFNTIEVRMHQGTTNTREMRGWILLLLNIIDSPQYPDILTITNLFHRLPGVAGIRRGLLSRHARYNREHK